MIVRDFGSKMFNDWQCPSLPALHLEHVKHQQPVKNGEHVENIRRKTENSNILTILIEAFAIECSWSQCCSNLFKISEEEEELLWFELSLTRWWRNSELAPACKPTGERESVIIVIICNHLYVSLLLTLHRTDYRHLEARRSMYRDWAYVVHILITRWLCLTLVWRGICVCVVLA